MRKSVIQVTLCSLILSGCFQLEDPDGSSAMVAEHVDDKQTTEIVIEKLTDDLVELQQYTSKYDSECKVLVDNSSTWVDFSHAVFADISDIHQVAVYTDREENITAQEGVEFVEKWLDKQGDTDVDLKRELRDASGQFESNALFGYPYDYPAVFDHLEELKSGNAFFINTPKCYIQVGGKGIQSMSNGTLTKLSQSTGVCGVDPYGIFTQEVVEDGTVEELSDRTYPLLVGEMTVGTAAEQVIHYFEEEEIVPLWEGMEIMIPRVQICKIANADYYCYRFMIARKYKGIPVSWNELGYRTYYEDYEAGDDSKWAYFTSGTVDAYVGNVYRPMELVEKSLSDSVLSLEEGTKRLKSFLPSNALLVVNAVRLVYFPVVRDGQYVYYPCWLYDCASKNNDKNIRYYVNVLSGEIYYYAY